MNKTLKKTLKGLKPPKVPDRVKLLSLLAIVLVVGAPALVSIIDDSYAVDLNQSVEYDYDKVRFVSYEKVSNIQLILDHLYDPVSGTYTVVYPAGASSSDYKSIVLEYTGTNFFDGSVRQLRFSPSFEAGKVYDYFFSDRNGVYDGSDWVISVSTVDNILNSQRNPRSVSTYIVPVEGESLPAAFTVDFEVIKVTSLPYGEIIIGATGAILLLCALLATPYFGVFKKKGVKS